MMNEHNQQALRMAQSLKNLDVDDLHYLIPVVGKMTRYFASINAVQPDFRRHQPDAGHAGSGIESLDHRTFHGSRRK